MSPEPASEQSVVHIYEFGPWPGRLGRQAGVLFLCAPPGSLGRDNFAPHGWRVHGVVAGGDGSLGYGGDWLRRGGGGRVGCLLSVCGSSGWAAGCAPGGLPARPSGWVGLPLAWCKRRTWRVGYSWAVQSMTSWPGGLVGPGVSPLPRRPIGQDGALGRHRRQGAGGWADLLCWCGCSSWWAARVRHCGFARAARCLVWLSASLVRAVGLAGQSQLGCPLDQSVRRPGSAWRFPFGPRRA